MEKVLWKELEGLGYIYEEETRGDHQNDGVSVETV